MDEQDKGAGPTSSSQHHSLNNESASKALALSSIITSKITTSSTSVVGSSSTRIDIDTVKAMGETIDVSNLQDEATKVLGDDITYRAKAIIQDAPKFMEQGRRQKLSSQDIDGALKAKKIETSYGFQAAGDESDEIPFGFVSGGELELDFVDEKEVEISELLAQPLPRVPLEPSLRANWLVIEEVQPAVPENNPPPQPCSMDVQRVDDSVADPSKKLKYGQGSSKHPEVESHVPLVVGKPIKFKTSELVFVKHLATDELSAELQLFYKEVVEACIGTDEMRRQQALGSLINDPGLYQLVPKLVAFIAEGVRINVGQFNLVFLIYLMRMVKGLLENPTLALERYLHDIIPSVATCIVTKQLCLRPEVDNHWALRDYAAKLMSHICKTYTNTTNNIQVRVTKIFCSGLKQQENKVVPLSTVYGALVGLGELGPEVIRAFIFPKVKEIGTRQEFCLDGVGLSPIDKTARIMIKQLLVKLLTPVLKSTRPGPDILDEYKEEFGCYLGPMLHMAVANLRSEELKQSKSTTTSTSVPCSGI